MAWGVWESVGEEGLAVNDIIGWYVCGMVVEVDTYQPMTTKLWLVSVGQKVGVSSWTRCGSKLVTDLGGKVWRRHAPLGSVPE